MKYINNCLTLGNGNLRSLAATTAIIFFFGAIVLPKLAGV